MTISSTGRFTITHAFILGWLLVNVHSAKGHNAPEVLSIEKVRNETSPSDDLSKLPSQSSRGPGGAHKTPRAIPLRSLDLRRA